MLLILRPMDLRNDANASAVFVVRTHYGAGGGFCVDEFSCW